MSWNLKGRQIRARYMEQTIEGTVIDSMVKPNYVILHTVKLSKPFKSKHFQSPKSQLLVDDIAIMEIL
jgi:hypothetical protein